MKLFASFRQGIIPQRKENLRYWNENFILPNFSKSSPIKNFSLQAISSEESIEKFEMNLFYKKGYHPFFENGISLCYENEEEDGISDSEVLDIIEIVSFLGLFM